MIFLVGCGNDPKAANDKNFTKVVKYFIESDDVCAIVELSGWSSMTTKDEEGYPQFDFRIDGLDQYKEDVALYDYWVEIGLMEESEYEKEGPSWGSGKVFIKTRRYILSETGKKEYDKDKGGFVIGKLKFDKLGTWTEPADMFGYKVSEAKYSYHVDINKEWAKDSRVHHKIKLEGINSSIERDKDIKEQLNAKIVLILTGKGWITEEQLDE